MYEKALLHDNDSPTSLQPPCRIKTQGRPGPQQRSMGFDSQAEFLTWIDHGKDSDVQSILSLVLRLTDANLSALLDPRACVDPGKRVSVWDIYSVELEKLKNALGSLPNVSSLTIISPENASSAFGEILYQPLLHLIPQLWPRLQALDLQGSEGVDLDIQDIKSEPDIPLKDLELGTGLDEGVEDKRTATVDFGDLLEAAHPETRAPTERTAPVRTQREPRRRGRHGRGIQKARRRS
ncbi:hypothetical protein LTR37_013353 [Vermiconidia calcicola]|uniref:Uncharacterized protein n=1 Tax=Vermiconidia calcicola TaxID=1690605 RepID=A0ACC3MY58_9PEZI|nr:hypothetical protein LTR37_013353 [Vermiconidia calcicola]